MMPSTNGVGYVDNAQPTAADLGLRTKAPHLYGSGHVSSQVHMLGLFDSARSPDGSGQTDSIVANETILASHSPDHLQVPAIDPPSGGNLGEFIGSTRP